MPTPNIEVLPAPETLAQMAEDCETLTSLMLIIPGIDTGAWAKTLREADASLQYQAERIKVLDGLYENATASHEDTMRRAMNAEAERDQARAELAAIRAQEPVAWNHGCNALCADIDLWIDHCPHCGKPRPAAPAPQEKDAARYRWLRERYTAVNFDWEESGQQAVIFTADDFPIASASCDETIDAAMGITGEPK